MTETIILCAGPINHTSLPIGTPQSNAMVPVNGKPVISWILDDLLRKNINSVTIVYREQDQRLQQFIEHAYAQRMKITMVSVIGGGTIIQSLERGLAAIDLTTSVRFILGDTLITDNFAIDEDFVYVTEVENSRRWCLVIVNKNDIIEDYLDKQVSHFEPKIALAGYYHFLSAKFLQTSVQASIDANETQLSAVLRAYGMEHSIRIRYAKEWHDFGNIDNLVKARRNLLAPRHFNTISIDPVLNTITKISENNQKLKDELDWYLSLPTELQVLTPRLVQHEFNNGKVKIVQEYYGYPTLAELYVFGDLHLDNWESILNHVLRIHDIFGNYRIPLDSSELYSVYADKTFERLDQLAHQSSKWKNLLDSSQITLNRVVLNNLPTLLPAIGEKIDHLVKTPRCQIIHGDFCFSNLLFDINNQIIRLIDPRGSFGRSSSIYGDARYDIAKLRHSVCGFYDFLTADMFQVLEEAPNQFTLSVFSYESSKAVAHVFDELLLKRGYSLNEIQLIEALLFVSMVPLHKDKPHRQLAMYLTGILRLNEVFQ